MKLHANAARSPRSRLRQHALEELRDLREPGAVGAVGLGARAAPYVGAKHAVTADGGELAGQCEASVRERDKGTGRVGTLGEQAVDRDAVDLLRAAGIAVMRIPGADGQAGTHGSRTLSQCLRIS